MAKTIGKRLLKGAIGAALMTGVSMTALSTAAYAQTEDGPAVAAPPADAEIIVVGIRRSLRSSQDIKKNTQGMVDAITAEDIGKFPDTNLAEAIQRIPGVTIDRSNNEGSRVTVRGFGPEYNLVTLNGRSMPASVGGGMSATRSFDFANLSADGIAGMAVFKTGRADVPSGGIGSTIDVTTARPFNYKGLTAQISAKAINDTSSVEGSDVTPEISGLFSNTFADGKVGFLVNGSYSERNSRLEQASIGGWLQNQDFSQGVVVDNNENPYGNTWAPQSEAWGFDDHERTRLNGQAVLQFRPTDSLTATVDYTYALYKDHFVSHTSGAWFGYGGDLHSATINEHGTAVNINDTGSDLSYSVFDDHIKNELKSTGLNLKWDATDTLTVNFDAHHSVADSGGDGANGNNMFMIVGQNPGIAIDKIFTVTDTDIPTTLWTYQAPTTVDNIGTDTILPLFGQANNNTFENKIDEARLDATWRNSSDSGLKSIKIGADYKVFETHAQSYNSGNFAYGYYNPADLGLMKASTFTKVDTCTLLEDFSGGGCDIAIPYIYTYDLAQGVADVQSKYPHTFAFPTNPTSDHIIKEDTKALYFVADFDTDFNGMRFRALAGLRYEQTNVTANSLEQKPVSVEWVNPTEFFTRYAADPAFSNIEKSYNEFLPSLDTSLQVTDKLLMRASYSKTITRSDLTSMVGTTSVSGTPKPGARTATAGNPGLLPYESNNIDLSAEYYYTRDSYVSINYFAKQVDNFLTQTTVKGPLAGLTDPMAGALAQTATAELIAANQPTTAANIFAQMQADTGQLTFTGQPGDPLITWDITSPSNANSTEIHGWEFAVQHIFADTGFGLQANLSIPTGGAQFDNEKIGSQFALPGLSKSYNLVGFYEKYGFQARAAFTHRGEFLLATSQGQSSNEPQYVEAYDQLDISASYDINPHINVFFDGINVTGSSQRLHGRYSEQFLNAYQGAARYQLGVRYKF
ncbi:TonB-dependent receptor [Asticcacaulis sp.]|uniref:TonB-dependent receptor n=1 Tax=Asticcacaulis sp. TaxID=1872648 RepID=UPI002CD6EF8A|nr:TonB-dependent receptor [Asticcacaulis sp.]HTM80531.1 TonB-dependent receptor [Asticcacaulis sp.]